MLIRALHAEALKLKRTIAWKMVFIAPGVLAALVFLMIWQAPYSTVARSGVSQQWARLEYLHLRLWGLLVIPMLIALQTALVASLDHNENHWKILCSRPVPRWTLFVSKLIVVGGMNILSTLLLALAVALAGEVLPHLTKQVLFPHPIPWSTVFRDSFQMMGLASLVLAIQLWVSMRWRSFSVAMGVGIVATIAGIFATFAGHEAGGWPRFFPWSLPMLVQEKDPPNLGLVLAVTAIAASAVVCLSCVEFGRREIQ